jgi:hypothetical protein
MPITEVKAPDGTLVSVKHPVGASKAQIIEYAKKNYAANTPVSDAPETTAGVKASGEAGSTLDYMLDQMKLEGGDLVRKIVPDPLLKYMTGGKVDPMRDMVADIEASGGVGQPIDPNRTRQQEYRQAEDIASLSNESVPGSGYQGLQPQDEMDRLLGIGARGAVDPMNLVGFGAKTAAGKAASLGFESILGGLTASGGALAGEAGSELTEDMGGGPMLQEMVGGTLGILAGVAVNSQGNFVRGVTEGALGTAKAAIKGLPVAGNKASDFLASSEVQAVIEKAALSEGGDLGAKVKAATRLMDEIPGLVIPTAAAAGDNPIIRKNFSELYSKYPEFRAKYDAAQKEAITKLKETTSAITDTVDIKQRNLRKLVETYSAEEIAAHNKLYRKRAESIDNQLAALAAKVSSKTDAASIGVAADNLMKAKVKAIEDSLKPRYEDVISTAERDGVTLPVESVARVYQDVQALKLSDKFGTFPDIVKMVEKNWSPQKGMFEPASVRDADSLKRAINNELRSTRDPAEQRILRFLKESVAEEMNKLPSTFVKEYRAVDYEWASRLGLPKNAEGVKALDRARFETSVGRQLSSFDQARDYLDLVGADGIPVVRDAMILAASGKVLTGNMDINPTALSRFIEANKNTIDLVPGLRQELSSTKLSATDLLEIGKSIEADYNDTAKRYTEGFYKAVKNENLDAVAQRILTKPGKRKEYLAEIKKMPLDIRKMAMTGVRQALLEKAKASGGNMEVFIQKNRDAFDDVLGKGYVDNLGRISRAYDILYAMEGSKGGMVKDFKQEDVLKRSRLNFSVEELFGTLRNQVMSMPRKVAHLGSKTFIRNAADIRDKRLMDLMLDTRGMGAMGDAAARVEAAARAGKANKELFDSLKSFGNEILKRTSLSLVRGGYFGAEGAEMAQENQAP